MQQGDVKKHMKELEDNIKKDRQTLRALDALSEEEKLVEIWKVLNALTVSIHRMGWYEAAKGHEAAKEALIEYMGPNMNKKIANARYLATKILQAHDPKMRRKLEKIAENEAQIMYWDGPTD